MQGVDRKHRIAVLLGLVILSSVACRTVAARESNPVPTRSTDSAPSLPSAPSDLIAPLQVGHYKRGEAKDYGSPEGGVSYDYSSKGTSLTVYFYARDSALRRLGAMEALEQETGRFKQVLEIERQRGRWDSYEIAFEDPDSVDVKSSVLHVRQLGIVIKRGQAMYVSLFYLYAVGDEWIEVRGTVPVSEWQRTDIPVFARQLSAMAVADRPKS
jgi:hypothetical protein